MHLAHGKLTTYVNRRCRCTECTAASSAYSREMYRRRAYGLVIELDRRRAGTHPREVVGRPRHRMGAGRALGRGGPPHRRPGPSAHPPAPWRDPSSGRGHLRGMPTLDNAAAGALIDAAGTQRRLQALMLAGHTLTTIQAATGTSALGRVLVRDTVTARIARLVRDYYDAHWDHVPTGQTPHAAGLIARTQTRARREGFLPALAWDDDTIDDPTAVGEDGSVRGPDTAVRIHLEDVEDLARFGATWPEVEHRIGACRNSIEVACGRADRRDLVARISSHRRVAA